MLSQVPASWPDNTTVTRTWRPTTTALGILIAAATTVPAFVVSTVAILLQ